MRRHVFCVAALLASAANTAAAATRASTAPPNIIVLITDDQDAVFGSIDVMPTLQSFLVEGGTSLSSAFVDVPVCCPSRTSTLSGLYSHSLNNTKLGWCGDFKEREDATFVRTLQQHGYTTGLFGKYYNAYSDFCGKNVHVPKGWTKFFGFCDDNKYTNITWNDDGVMTPPSPTYMTSDIGNATVEFLTKALAGTAPVFAYIAPHAPHVPSTPAPWYVNASVPPRAPRTPNWGVASPTKHWLVAQQPEMSEELVNGSDAHYGDRLRTLMSVDDILAGVVAALEAVPGALENTYILFTSDHGYSLGQFRLAAEKYHVYENDIRVPLLVRGPGIPANATAHGLVNNVDLAATILDLSGVVPAGTFHTDGTSFKPLLLGAAERKRVRAPPQSSSFDAYSVDVGATPSAEDALLWPRDRLVVEYWGLGYVERGPCDHFVGPCPGGAAAQALLDAPSNTYSALRIINATHNLLYAEFRPSPTTDPLASLTNWTEVFDISADPYQLTNLWPSGLPAATLAQLQTELYAVARCAGSACP
jgi:N-acetylglucosamine-6-sulfatase